MGLNFYFKLTKQRARSRVSSAYIPPHAVASGREMHNFYFIFLPHTSHTRAQQQHQPAHSDIIKIVGALRATHSIAVSLLAY